MKQVTICRFLLPAPGDFCVSMLQSQGIDAWLDNANLATMNPFYSVAISGIQLKVPEDQAEAAREILSNPPFPEGELPEGWEEHMILANEAVEKAPEVQETCPNCGSDRVAASRFPLPIYILWSVFAFLFSVAGFMHSSGPARRYCRQCGWSWTIESGGFLPVEDDEGRDDAGDPSREGEQEYDQD
jgi:hypothetical protein